MSTKKAKYFVLVAFGVMMASLVAATTTMTLTPMNLKATSDEEDNDDRDDSPALTMTKESTNPSGHDSKEIQSDEHSERAAAVLKIETDHKVKQDSTDEPAHKSERTVERGEESETTFQESAEQSSGAESTGALIEELTIAHEGIIRPNR